MTTPGPEGHAMVTLTTWLDSLSLTSGPLNHRLRYRALCDMRARMHAQYHAAVPEAPVLLTGALRRAAEQLESMHRYADQYLRIR